MSHRRLRGSQAAIQRYADAADALIGYPIEASTRGRNCPPAPFGRTERWAVPELDPADDTYVIEYPDDLEGRSVVVRGTRVTFRETDTEPSGLRAAASGRGKG